jgi:signal transduction histidine kinase
VFQNLIRNALKYSRAGVTLNININYRQVTGRDVLSDKPSELLSRDYHFIEISDNGIGFLIKCTPTGSLKFLPAFMVMKTIKVLALSLSIVRKVIESHNGFVWATSEPNAGSSFKFILPIA